MDGIVLVVIVVVGALCIAPIVAVIQIFKLRGELERQTAMLERLLARPLARREAPARPAKTPVAAQAPVVPRTVCEPTDVPEVASRPETEDLPPALPETPPLPAPCIPDEALPFTRAYHGASPALAPSLPPVPTVNKPAEEPSEAQRKVMAVLQRIWNWIVIGDEYRRPGVSWEFAVATNWLLRGGIVVVVVGVGFFLKYSMDHGLLGPQARVALSVLAGVAMLVGGVRLVGRPYHLLGQGLMGGGLAILYFSMFAACNLYHLVGPLVAFGLMALVTVVAGTLAARLNSLLVAVLGILGGYGTPIMLSTGAKNFPGLFGYMLLLGIGILGIARLRHWPLLNYLGLLLTYGLGSAAIVRQYAPEDLAAVLPFLVAFFVLYAAVMVLHNLLRRQPAGLLELLGIMANALAFFGLTYDVLQRSGCHLRLTALPALALAVFFVLLARIFLAGGWKDRGLLYTFLGMAALFTALTPSLALSRQWVTASWSLQGVVMLWLAGKIGSRFLRLLGLTACLLAIGRVACLDLHDQFRGALPPDLTALAYLRILGERLLAVGVPIAAIGAAWRLTRTPPPRGALAVAPENDMASDAWQGQGTMVIALLGVLVLFVYAHFELHRTCGFFFPALAVPSMTLAWVAMGLFLLAVARRCAAVWSWLPAALGVLAAGLVVKMIVWDMDGWALECDDWWYGGAYSVGVALVRLLDFGLCLALFAVIFAQTRCREAGRRVGLFIGIAALVILFLYLTLEVNTMLHAFVPGLRAGGVTLLWAAYALTLLIFGLRRGVAGLRYAGLVGFTVVTGKIFFVDLAHLDALYKIVAFIVLGVILLLAAWGYLRCRLRFQPSAEGEGK